MRLPSLVLVLALVAPVPALAGVLRAVAPCDYERLTTAWGVERAQVKRQLRADARIGTVIDTPRGPMVDAVWWQLQVAQKIPAECSFSQTAYTTADADALAAVWGTDRAGARAFVEQKIASGQENGVLWALEAAHGGSEPEKVASPEGAALDAFWASDRYSYCDARLVAGAWKVDPFDTKIAIGNKLLAKDRAALRTLEQTLAQARHLAIARGEGCTFWETDYSLEDAQRLASVWGMSLEDTKTRVADMVLRGQNEAVLDALRRAR